MSETATTPAPVIKSRIGAILRATSGNFLEQFDFFLFGFYAQDIAKAFFPPENETAALLNAYGVFWLGALMRPVGAIVLGAYIDRIGRRKGLIVTLALMAIGTVVIAFCPSYAIHRHRCDDHRADWPADTGLFRRRRTGRRLCLSFRDIDAWQSRLLYLVPVFQSAGRDLCRGDHWLYPERKHSRGHLPGFHRRNAKWRIPFFVGCIIIPVIFFLRRTLEETPEFLEMKKHPTASEVFASAIANWRIVVLGMMIAVLTTTTFYFITVYAPTFGKPC